MPDVGEEGNGRTVLALSHELEPSRSTNERIHVGRSGRTASVDGRVVPKRVTEAQEGGGRARRDPEVGTVGFIPMGKIAVKVYFCGDDAETEMNWAGMVMAAGPM
jgi:hypothetical protein